MNKTRFEKIKKVLEKRQADLTVLMDNVHKPHNLAAIARTCDAVGIYDIHATSANENIKITQKTSGGVKKWTRLTQHESISSAMIHLKKTGHQLITAHLEKDSINFRDVDFTKKTAVVIGAELDGVSKEALELSDKCIYIPMNGMTQSLNVSVACALILFEAERQREKKGMYSKPSIPDKNFKNLLFEWTYPDIAAFCNKKKINYPDFDTNSGKLLKRFSTMEYKS
ncbi:MAG: tRNA (guanosine(18)-2'-O)-methyltransferase TrmH [Deltaproteobacteria bacterium]|nr:MAG: tRNA (guanosine(18)-2'-O)-methyltransferase TrmH [Deltaproteobacteria bacterium]